MKKIFLLLLFTFLLTLFSCDNKIYHWEFHHSYEEISQMKIIEITEGFDYVNIKFNYTEIQKIDLSLAEEVYNDIINLDMKHYGPFTDLRSPYGKCILIVFDNGEYDIISRIESKHFQYKGKDLMDRNSWLSCDKNEFDKLINKYLNCE